MKEKDRKYGCREYNFDPAPAPAEVREPLHGARKMTPAEYLQWEADQEEKHEFYQGEVFAMARR